MSSPSSVVIRVSAASCSFVWLLAVGCQRGEVRPIGQGPTPQQLVQYYSPKSIKVLPFTKPRSFDEDAVPDGIAVYLQPLDSAADPVKAYGTFIFELHSYQPASGGRRGELLQTWTQPIVTPEDQKQFWERVTKMYEFQLSWEGKPLVPQRRYILAVSFQAPGSERLFDEYQFEFRVERESILQALTQEVND